VCIATTRTSFAPDANKCIWVPPKLSDLTGEWVGGGVLDGKSCTLCYSSDSQKECNDCLARKGQGDKTCKDGQCSGICPKCWESHSVTIADSEPGSCSPFSHVQKSLTAYKAWCPSSTAPCVAHDLNCLNSGRCCSPNDKCMAQDPYYAQCREDCPKGWACNNATLTALPIVD
jgi:hypothetical protein